MDKKLLLRLLMILVILWSFFNLGLPIEVILILGIIFVAIVLLRGKIFSVVENAIEKYLPFTKEWPHWAQRALVLLFFIMFYILLKQVIFFSLGFIGIDVQAIIMQAYGNNL